MMRFTVHEAILPSSNTTAYLILDHKIPDVAINRYVLLKQKGKTHLNTTKIYYLCVFLNYLDAVDLDVTSASLPTIEAFLSSMYTTGISCINRNQPVKYEVLCDYIEAISAFYEYWVLAGYPYDESLIHPSKAMYVPHNGAPRKGHVVSAGEHMTQIHLLKNLYTPTSDDARTVSYTKWYSKEEIEAIAAALSFTYRCIFLISVYTGFRIDSILSMTTDTVNIQACTVRPTRSKTGKMHTAVIPFELAMDLQTYLIENRSIIVSNTDSSENAFFLSRAGTPMSYSSYRRALEAARIKINDRYGWHIDKLHTHAGRSTFAATLRTYQLEQQRLGKATFSDVDFCNLMDWASLDSLKHYDLVTRSQDVSPMLLEYYSSAGILNGQKPEDASNES